MKRFQSFLITLGAFVATAIAGVVASPVWGPFVAWANATFQNHLLGYGVPAVVVAVIIAFIGEVIRQLVNAYKASKTGYSTMRYGSAARRELDLF